MEASTASMRLFSLRYSTTPFSEKQTTNSSDEGQRDKPVLLRRIL